MMHFNPQIRLIRLKLVENFKNIQAIDNDFTYEIVGPLILDGCAIAVYMQPYSCVVCLIWA